MKKKLTVEEIIAAELRFGERWFQNAGRNLDEAGELVKEARIKTNVRRAELEKKGEKMTGSDMAVLKEALDLQKECLSEQRFYDGVLTGMRLMKKAVTEKALIETLDGIKKK